MLTITYTLWVDSDSRFNGVASVHDFHLLALHSKKCEAIPVGGDKAPGISDSTKQETPFTLQLDTLGRDKVSSTGCSTAQFSLNPRRYYYTGFCMFYGTWIWGILLTSYSPIFSMHFDKGHTETWPGGGNGQECVTHLLFCVTENINCEKWAIQSGGVFFVGVEWFQQAHQHKQVLVFIFKCEDQSEHE